MNFVHTFWSKPLFENKFNTFKTSLEIIMHTYNMSADMIKVYGHTITLYTDTIGAHILNFIPYDKIVIIDIPDTESVHFAAQMKIHALEQMELGDILIDGDLFLWKQKGYDVLEHMKEDVIVSLYEDTDYVTRLPKYIDLYTNMLKIFNTVELKDPYHIKTLDDLGWPNTSLLRFNNQKAKDEYIAQYKYHKSLFQKIDFKEAWPDIFIEQKFLELLCKDKGYTYKPVIEDFTHAQKYAEEIGFVHLGGAKTKYLPLVENWLKENDKERYNYTKEVIKNIL